jgi:hypothetical protein
MTTTPTTAATKIAGLVLASKNAKIGDVSATYASIEGSCPSDCAHRDAGCYAQLGNVGIHSKRLDRANAVRTREDAREVARAEAREIKAAIVAGEDTRPLRIHVAGDCRTPSAAREIASAVEGWRPPVWSYTHAWKRVARENWGKVSVLASVDRAEDLSLAFERGYAPAIVVGSHPANGKAYTRPEDGVRVIPCPNQTRDVTCVQCGLCMNATRLHATRSAIAFAAHSVMKRRLTVIK